MKSVSALTCPKCGFTETLKMPIDQCVVLHKCSNCETILRPEKDDCCVFCSFGDIPCPSKQKT